MFDLCWKKMNEKIKKITTENGKNALTDLL